MEVFLALSGLGIMIFLILAGVALNQWVEKEKAPPEKEEAE